ncbi:MAG: peptidylprolyl isomerase [Bacteroidetes bacterium CG12_big_fil_rev_8_21_14_0_65_60_17]|nr:MAG: peptidylprolyl isomerase [Bacteroidetes bacterium CG12_big_fil_rev_8_21_14_0_65_60_17]
MTITSCRLILLVSLVLTPMVVHAQDDTVLDEIVAVVGSDIILASDVDGFVLGIMNQQKMPYTQDLWDRALQQIIDEQVLVIHAKRDTNIVVGDQQVEQMLDSRVSQMARRMGGEARLEALYGKSVLELKDEFREEIRNQALSEQMRNQKLRNVRATPSDVEAWLSQIPPDSLPTMPDMVRISHIVALPEITDDAREEAMEILSTIRDTVLAGGATMEEMAELFSDDPGSAPNGGLYEDMALSDLVPEFAAVAARSPIGVYSPIFETQFGLHFLRINARRGDRIDYNHILIEFDESDSDAEPAIELLSTLRDSILAGKATFEKLAREFSDEEASRSRAGAVIDPNTGEKILFVEALGPMWQATLAGLEEGDISEPREVTLQDGRRAYHIVRLEERIPEHTVSLETDYALIERRALQDKQDRIMREWMKQLKETVYIELRGRALRNTTAANTSTN